MLRLAKASILAVALLGAACATLGLTPASSFNQRLAYAYGSHTALLQATTQALEAGDIGSEDATRVLALADQSRQALDAARLASDAGDAATAQRRLQLATALLAELQTYLRKPR